MDAVVNVSVAANISDDGLGAFDGDAIRDARFLGVAWLALLGFTEDDGLFFSLGAVVFGPSRVIGVVEEEV